MRSGRHTEMVVMNRFEAEQLFLFNLSALLEKIKIPPRL